MARTRHTCHYPLWLTTLGHSRLGRLPILPYTHPCPTLVLPHACVHTLHFHPTDHCAAPDPHPHLAHHGTCLKKKECLHTLTPLRFCCAATHAHLPAIRAIPAFCRSGVFSRRNATAFAAAWLPCRLDGSVQLGLTLVRHERTVIRSVWLLWMVNVCGTRCYYP